MISESLIKKIPYLSFIAIVFLSACDKTRDLSSDKTIVFKLSENQPPSNPVTQAMYKFADLVKEKSNGKMIIDVYPSRQLGSETESIEQIQLDLIDFIRVNSVTLGQTASEVGVFTLPYIFKDRNHKYKVLDGYIGQAVSKDLEKYNMLNLGYLEAGTRNFYTHKPVTSIKGLKGMKIRVQPSDIPLAMVKMIGAVPTPMNYGEVYSSLQTGVIDGAENDFVSYSTSSHYEVAKNYILDGHLSPPALILMSKKTFDKLSLENQRIIVEAAEEAAIWQREAMFDFEKESEKKVRAAGSKIIEVDKKPFQKAVEGIYEKYPEYEDRINRIKNIADL